MKGDKNLWVLIGVCVVNSLGFGIIVPLLYAYGKRFGVTEVTIGYLTASFSIAQFFATPLLGALSDKWGRKPILAISLAGTCLSFILFATATNIYMLFAARILDGITGGNISVAQAMVSDSSTADNRAKKFGFLSSAFGFGFVLGPALGGLLSKFGLQFPFFFAAGIALMGTLATVFLLKETYTASMRKKGADNKFNFSSLITGIKMPVIGTAVITGFLLTMAQFTMIIGFQTFSVDVLKISPTKMGLFYAVFGIAGIIMQMCVPLFTKVFSSKSVILLFSTLICLGAMFATGFTNTFMMFAVSLIIYASFNGLRNPMLNAIIADHNDQRRQGEVLGINQSYASIGQTLGPVCAGLISAVSVHAVFFLSSFYILLGFLLSIRLKTKEHQHKAT
ncbi:MFS transporter [Mucilaginibacter ginkgonis]|uniref:MFS transporter n=1 Tax=Mucilaginibacter ginkgonis TaxID=2682091 RepID=A0A6I4HVJ8_9SPHI|nr:MFS transporter [Mucilaginibacter ginkgonis]QQL50042.1 MFS transporter [Mucilaginibacter ginkgonis]